MAFKFLLLPFGDPDFLLLCRFQGWVKAVTESIFSSCKLWVSCALVLILWEKSLNEGHLELASLFPRRLPVTPHSDT